MLTPRSLILTLSALLTAAPLAFAQQTIPGDPTTAPAYGTAAPNTPSRPQGQVSTSNNSSTIGNSSTQSTHGTNTSGNNSTGTTTTVRRNHNNPNAQGSQGTNPSGYPPAGTTPTHMQ